MAERTKAPVFVLGSPRSGTTLLYHMLLSAGNFAVYRTESHVFNMIAPKFGNLATRRSREALMDKWLDSIFFRRSGLDAETIRATVINECRSAGDFLKTVMEAIARKQSVDRWAECTPEHLLYIREIKRALPNVLVIHIIRDGRDVALSMDRMGWIAPFPWDRGWGVAAAALYWEWIVRRGRSYGSELGADYTEVRFEDLVSQPRQALERLAAFVEHDLDYDRILSAGIGSVSLPNTSFEADLKQGTAFNPIGRFKTQLPGESLLLLESLTGKLLLELGYELATPTVELAKGIRVTGTRQLYRLWFSLRHWAKSRTPLGRLFVRLDLMQQ